MPTYVYNCRDCAATLEQRQRFDEDPLTRCPSCGGSLRRIYQPVGVIFKGSGWYCTDNRPKPGSEPGGAGGDSKPKAESDGAGGDSKPKAESNGASGGSKPKVESNGAGGDSKPKPAGVAA